MADNTTMVTLCNGEDKREFTIEHAEGLIKMNLRGGSDWKLADDNYEMVDGSLHRKASRKDTRSR
jgi:hypothetical protein